MEPQQPESAQGPRMPAGIRSMVDSAEKALERMAGGTKQSVWSLPPGWVWGIAPIIFAALRVLVVSHGEIETLRALVQNLNVTALILATVLPYGAVVSLGFVIFQVSRLSPDKSPIKGGPLLLLISVVITLFLLVYAMPTRYARAAVFLVGIIGVIALIVIVIASRAKKGDENGAPTAVMILVGLGFLGLLSSPVIYLLNGSGMWLPKEKITVAEISVSPVYVLSSDDHWTSYMDEDRKVHLVTTSDITSRDAIGSSGSWLDKSIFDNAISGALATGRWMKTACQSASGFVREHLPKLPPADTAIDAPAS